MAKHSGIVGLARGFSLIEVMLVIVLVALIFTLLPRLSGNGVSGAQLKSDVRLLATAMKLARDTAINTRRETFVAIDVERREFTTGADGGARALHPGIDLALYTAQADRVDERVARFRFFPDGSSNGGRVTVAVAERRFHINIDWLTGRATVTEPQS